MIGVFEKDNWYWQLENGTVWSTKKADFVDETEATAWANSIDLPSIPPSPVDASGVRSLRGLIEALEFYGLPKGTLKDEWERIQEILTVYQPQLDTLTQAFTAANILDDSVEAAVIKSEYQEVINAMESEIEAISD